MSPVYKKGEKYDAANYRPVSLTCICCKTLEHILVSIRGRLITPFVLGYMSVGLNILIRHSFMDLWFWITALVPWPQLLFTTRLVSLPGGRSVRPRGHRQPSIINMVAHINSDKIVAGTSPTIKKVPINTGFFRDKSARAYNSCRFQGHGICSPNRCP